MDAPRIRVLVTAFAPVPGGSPHDAALGAMASALHAELDLVTVKTERLGHLEQYGEARMLRVPMAASSYADQVAAFCRAVSRQLDTQPYDVVHVRGPHEGAVAADRRRELGYRFVYEIATFAHERDGQETETAWSRSHDKCLEAADLILVPSQAAGRSLSERGFGGKVAVVAPGVDVDAFDWWPSVPGDPPRLLYVGPFEADRDIGTLLSSIRHLSSRRAIQVLMAGESAGEARDRLRRLVDAFRLNDMVQVRGEPRPPMLPSLVAACDLALVPAAATMRFRDLGDIPQPLLEYMACRRPVVAARVPGVAEVCRDGREGLLYTPGDERSLTRAIEALIDDADLAERSVDAAYRRVRARFAGGVRRRRIAEIYETLMPESQRFDSWYAAFDEDETGVIPLPTNLFRLGDSPEWTSLAGELPDAIYQRAHVTGGDDTNPEVLPIDVEGAEDTKSTELPGGPTAVEDSVPPGAATGESGPDTGVGPARNGREPSFGGDRDDDRDTGELPIPDAGTIGAGEVKDAKRAGSPARGADENASSPVQERNVHDQGAGRDQRLRVGDASHSVEDAPADLNAPAKPDARGDHDDDGQDAGKGTPIMRGRDPQERQRDHEDIDESGPRSALRAGPPPGPADARQEDHAMVGEDATALGREDQAGAKSGDADEPADKNEAKRAKTDTQP